MALLSIWLILLGLLGSSNVLAQQSVRSELNLERAESVRISGIDDWFIGVFTATESINNLQYQWDPQCVYSSTGGYTIEVSSANAASPLQLESANGDSMVYQIYSFSRQGNRFTLRGHNDPIFALNNLRGSQSPTCNDEISNTNLWFTAVVRPAAFNSAPPGIYRDVVTLVVSPE